MTINKIPCHKLEDHIKPSFICLHCYFWNV